MILFEQTVLDQSQAHKAFVDLTTEPWEDGVVYKDRVTLFLFQMFIGGYSQGFNECVDIYKGGDSNVTRLEDAKEIASDIIDNLKENNR